MYLELYGYSTEKAAEFRDLIPEGLECGRVLAAYRDRYSVITERGEFDAEITGHLRYTAGRMEDFPAPGDWVAVQVYEPDLAIIHSVLPRNSLIRRRAAGHQGDTQVIAANIDYALLVQAADRDFNLNRLERYLTLCYDAGVKPVIILSKTDLLTEEQLKEMEEKISLRAGNIPFIPVSNLTGAGYEKILNVVKKGHTCCLLGSSGVGKSTLLNNLSGKQVMQTGPISASTNKGRHVTSHREMILLENGGLLLDNPGMKEVGLTESNTGLENTFDTIIRLAEKCRFKDCRHNGEEGCAVSEAVSRGELDRASYENYLRMEREREHFETTVAERRKKEKQFGKILKDYHKKDLKNRK